MGGRLQEVPNVVIWPKTVGILENWSLKEGGRLREVVATGGLTVYPLCLVKGISGYTYM